MTFHTIDEAIDTLRAGGMVIVCDREDRENEGDLVALGDRITTETVNFMATHARGLICAPITKAIAKRLRLPLMTDESTDPHETAFTISVDHASSTTGISAEERATTIQALANDYTSEFDMQRPGHIFPLIAKNNGVLERAGHTEATVDLARLAGAKEVGVICEIMNEDGTMARVPELLEFSQIHQIPIISIEKLIEYRQRQAAAIAETTETELETEYGTFQIYIFKTDDHKEHMALVKGSLTDAGPITTRIHSECLTGDLFHSKHCDCGEQLHQTLEAMQREEKAILLYLRQEGRGIGLFEKIKAYELQKGGLDTVEANEKLGFKADERDFSIAGNMLHQLGVNTISLITNNPEKVESIKSQGIHVHQVIHTKPTIYPANERYVMTKQEKLGHLIP
ncbi:bifunctional 3,4-dihydroxy-2-butanone-4-phosphate synthase/GTP cyclohydrolase II [Geomicrobium sp. JCM 19055]|uniref:bifunctional 3,4-dihydroxy-2-butanone-4-phosphate synthase/GTP cyclohydrolase II n=1 Tax=Geomicrobium sp. JCM 19055 TaxID=1460649 RepID=UPI00045ED615|nr:bifunctional 3,4-dihydroxy-2-butanone-4-phosphate synthase/GTP cyclohydrolase II [Geomicrobium sp. JCM 19055]GAK01437.1 3,4-dihydroxy-2-butanone 4-phosphate synthase [Geomicrobium sp. JCM 19055]